MVEKIKEIMGAVTELLLSKHAKYGSKNLEKHGEKGILIRLSDKLSRLQNMVDIKQDCCEESVVDTAMDMIGYLVQFIRLRREQPDTKSESVKNIVKLLGDLNKEEKMELLKNLDLIQFKREFSPQREVEKVLKQVDKIFGKKNDNTASKETEMQNHATVFRFDAPISIGSARRVLEAFFPNNPVRFDTHNAEFNIGDTEYKAKLSGTKITITPALDVAETIMRRVVDAFDGWVEW